MKKLTHKLAGSLMAFFIIMLALPLTIYAQKTNTPEPEESVVLSYTQAVELVMNNLALQEVDEIISEMHYLRRDLRNDIRRLERGEWKEDTLQALFDELSDLTMHINDALIHQDMMLQNTELSLQAIIDSITDPQNAGYLSSDALRAAIIGMIDTQNMGGSISMMEMRIFSIFDEIAALENSERRREITYETRRDLNKAYRQLERQMEVLNLGQQQSKLVIENTLRSLIITVIELETRIEAMEAELVLTEENLRRVTVRHQFGRASVNELRNAQQALLLAQMDLAQHKTSLYSAHNSLNHLLGQPLSQYTVIEFEATLLHENFDLSDHIRRAIPSTPTISQLQLDVDWANEARRAYRGNNRDTQRELREAYERTVLTRNQAMRTMEAALRRANNELTNLQTTMEVRQLELYRAIQRLEAAETNLSLGTITRHEVEQAKLAVFHAEQAIASTLNQKWMLIFRIENPSLLH